MTPISLSSKKFADAIDHFEKKLKQIRVGRPSPELFNDVKVEAYGSKTNIESVASVNIVDATLVTIQPWDKSLAEAIEKGIQAAELGFNPSREGDLIRIPIPPLNKEKREEFVKKTKELAEEARIAVRQIRKDVMDWLDNEKESGNIPEDDYKLEKENLQKSVDETNEKIEEISKAKEEALMTV